MRKNILGRKGTLTFYALIILLILGYYISSLQTSSIDQALANKFAFFESQAKLGADSGLDICLRSPSPCQGVASWSVYYGQINVGTISVYFQNIPGANVLASSTAFVRDRNGQLISQKSAQNRFNIATRKFNLGFWSR